MFDSVIISSMDSTYETIGTAQALKDAGVEAKHAEAIADAIVRNRGELATKTDVNWLKWGLGINIVLTICSLTIAIALLVNQLGN